MTDSTKKCPACKTNSWEYRKSGKCPVCRHKRMQTFLYGCITGLVVLAVVVKVFRWIAGVM